MYRIKINEGAPNEFIVDGKLIGFVTDVEARAIINYDGAAELIAKEEGVIIKTESIITKGKRLVIVSDEFPTKKGKEKVVHISPQVEFRSNHPNKVIGFYCKGDVKYKLFPLN